MKRQSLILFLIFNVLFINIFAQTAEEGEKYFRSYQFDKAADAWQDFLFTLPVNDSRIPKLKKDIRRANLAYEMLMQVEDVAIIDSIQADKDDFLKFYKFAKELGTVNIEKNSDKASYATERDDRRFFSDLSDRGTLDIFYQYKLLYQYSIPQPLTADIINTKANESFPFLLLNGLTLYFASDGDNSIGGYDIFVTRFLPASQTYLPPINIGMPYNSPDNDYMMVLNEEDGTGWFATDRRQPKGKVMLFHFAINNLRKTLYDTDSVYLRKRASLEQVRTVKNAKPEIEIYPDTVEVTVEAVEKDTVVKIPNIIKDTVKIVEIQKDTVIIELPKKDTVPNIVETVTVPKDTIKVEPAKPDTTVKIVEIPKDTIKQEIPNPEIPKIDTVKIDTVFIEPRKPEPVQKDTIKPEIPKKDTVIETVKSEIKPDTVKSDTVFNVVEVIAVPKDTIKADTVKIEVANPDTVKIDTVKSMPAPAVVAEKIHVIINDSTVYTVKSQFKSPDALNYFNDYQAMAKLLSQQQSELETSRTRYVKTDGKEDDNTAEKQALMDKILQLESSIRQLTEMIEVKLKEMINTENRALLEHI